MKENELNAFLLEHTENEKYYLKHKSKVSKRFENNEFKKIVDGKEVFVLTSNSIIDQPISIRKDSRYTFMPFFTYECININYIYSGECTYFIENEEVILKKGDFCIFDKEVIRTKMKGKYEDIIINILMQEDYFKNAINLFDNSNLLASFVANTMSFNVSHKNYIIFRTNDNQKIAHLMNLLLIEYYENNSYSNKVIQNYFSIIFIELLCLYEQNTDNQKVVFSNKTSNNVYNIIQYIESHYVDCSLSDLSIKFNYHEKYICSLLKLNLNKTFKQLQTEFRLKYACRYLIHSNLSINEIADKVGFYNHNQFYRCFKQYYKILPAQYRIDNQKKESY